MRKRLLVLCPLALALSMFLGAASAWAQTISYATFVSPRHPTVEKGIAPMSKRLGKITQGKSSIRVYPAGQLLGSRAVLGGISSGVADSGLVIAQYFPKKIPHVLTLADMAAYGEDPLAIAGAVNEMVLLHCDSCRGDYAKNNAVMLAAYSTTGYIFLCRRPLESMDDLSGLKVKSTGVFSARLAKMGAVPVNVPASENAEALERGQVGCILGPMSWLDSYGMQDSVSNIVDTSVGANRAMGLFVMNKRVFSGLDSAERDAIIGQMPELIADVMLGEIQADEAARQGAAQRGISISTGDEKLKAAIISTDGEAEILTERAKQLGVDNQAEMLKQFEKIMARWEGIIKKSGIIRRLILMR